MLGRNRLRRVVEVAPPVWPANVVQERERELALSSGGGGRQQLEFLPCSQPTSTIDRALAAVSVGRMIDRQNGYMG